MTGVAGGDGDDLAVVRELERWTVEHLVRRSIRSHLDLQQAAAEREAEGEPLQPRWQPRCEGELPVVVAHPAEAGHRRDPGACE